MTQPTDSISSRVVIAGGGVAGLESLLALRALAGDGIALTLVSKDDQFLDRPMTVAEPFGLGSPARLSLPEVTAEVGADFVRGSVTAVDGANRRVTCADGRDLALATLILALGAGTRAPFPDAITFGLEGSGKAIRSMLDRLRAGDAHSVSFVAPT